MTPFEPIKVPVEFPHDEVAAFTAELERLASVVIRLRQLGVRIDATIEPEKELDTTDNPWLKL